MRKKKESTFQRLTGGKLNRQQRRKLERQLASSDPGLTIVHPNAGGIDVGNESHFVAVPPDRDPNPVQEFGCWTADLVRMAEWLKACRIDTVAVQATGVYWFALHDILVERGLQVTVANAHHTKNVPGRKSDVQMRFQLLRPECQWLMKLQCAFNSCANTYGLLRNSFRLEKQMEKVRTIWRVRDRYVKDAAQNALSNSCARSAAHAESVDEDEHSAGQRHQRHQRSERTGDRRSHPAGRARPFGARTGKRITSWQT